jgi:hypothetical protein
MRDGSFGERTDKVGVAYELKSPLGVRTRICDVLFGGVLYGGVAVRFGNHGHTSERVFPPVFSVDAQARHM